MNVPLDQRKGEGREKGRIAQAERNGEQTDAETYRRRSVRGRDLIDAAELSMLTLRFWPMQKSAFISTVSVPVCVC